jgi:hypothetical protein
MTRYLGLTEAEMAENEKQWSEEQGDTEQAPADAVGLRSVGISPGSITADLDNIDAQSEEGVPGTEPGADMGAEPAPAAPGAGVGMASPVPAV